MRHPIRAFAAPTAAAVLVFSGSVAATADTVTKRDVKGDAPTQIDITKTTYAYDSSTVSVDARIPGLGRSGDAALSISQFDVFEAGYVGRIQRAAGGAPKIGLFYFDHFNLKKRKCDGISATWKPGRIQITVPTTCLDKGFPSTKVFAQFGISVGDHVDRAPAIRRLAQTP